MSFIFRVPGTAGAVFVSFTCAKVVFFRYTANILQVFFIVSCIFFVFPSLGVLCRWCFLVFFFVFSIHPCGLPLIIYMYTHARGRGWIIHRGGDHPTGGGWWTSEERGRRSFIGGCCSSSGGRRSFMGGADRRGRRGSLHGCSCEGCSFQRWRGGGLPVGEGAGHICGGNRGRCVARPRSVAAALACESGVFCGGLGLKVSVLGVFSAADEGSKRDWRKDLLIFFRNLCCIFVCFDYITRVA